MMVQALEEMGEGSADPTDIHNTPIITQPSTSQPQKKKPRRKLRKDTEIDSLKKRVKKLEKKKRSRTHRLKRLYKDGLSAKVISFDDEGLGDQEDASKQGRKIADIDANAEVTLIDETQGMNDDNLMFDTSVLDEQEFEVEKGLLVVGDRMGFSEWIVITH
ncbi:hypothetical protein Tco_1319390 [Tanacetum coccineum]